MSKSEPSPGGWALTWGLGPHLGFGWKTVMPCMAVSNLCKYVCAYVLVFMYVRPFKCELVYRLN